MTYARDLLGTYQITGALAGADEADILAAAEDIFRRRLERLGTISNPRDSGEFFRARLGGLDHEEFHAMWLDNRHRILAVDCLALGTIDGASVHPREVIKAALKRGAAAVVFSHNHPSGVCQESQADIQITKELTEGLRYIGVRVLDHLIVSADREPVSLAARGLL